MNVTVYGAGYVGLVSAVCFAELGHNVACFDIDKKKIDLLSQGNVPIYEPGLAELLQKNLAVARLHFTTDAVIAVSFGEIHIIAVGTPSREDGSVDMEHVFSVARMIGDLMEQHCTIVTKSTVPVGTTEKVRQCIMQQLHRRELSIEFTVVSNPEFLKEGEAVSDFMNPDRIIIGATQPQVIENMRRLYSSLINQNKPFVVMDERSAEFTKYVANAFLATKISFMNEMSQLADRMDVNIEKIKYAIGLDKRIGMKFLNPGCGFGGSCFPKDIQAMKNFAAQLNYPAEMINAVFTINEAQKRVIFEKIYHYFHGDLKNKIIALWGLAFKPNTDDVRSAPSLTAMELLWKHHATIQAYDPLAMKNIQSIYGERNDFHGQWIECLNCRMMFPQ